MVQNLGHLDKVGGSRRPLYLNRNFLFLIYISVVSAFVQSIIYFSMNTRHTHVNWTHSTIFCLLLAISSILSAAMLYSLKQNKSPIATAIVVSSLFLAFTLSFASAMRLDLSFSSLLAAIPVPIFFLAYANFKLQSRGLSRVAIVPFKDSDAIRDQIVNCTVLSSDTDIREVDAVLIDVHEHVPEWSNFLAKCQTAGIPIIAWQEYIERTTGRIQVDEFDASQILYSPMQVLYAKTKRILDILFVIFSSPVWIPTCLILSLYILIIDGAPSIFVQQRKGLGGKEFSIYKLRTMYKGKGGGATGLQDTRILPGCLALRLLRLDELPQMINILKGEMSLIGPRPEATDLAKWYRSVIPEYDYRTLVLPGLTGWAQVNNGYTSNPDEAKLKLSFDLYYIKNFSMDLDIAILFKTIKTVVMRSSVR